MSQELGSNSLAFYLTQKFEKEKKKKERRDRGLQDSSKGFRKM